MGFSFQGLQTLVPGLGDAGISLPYTLDPSVLPNGAMPSGWIGATAAIASGKIVITPTQGAEDITNSNMETGSPPSNWSAVNLATLTSVADERTGGAGSKSLSVTNGGVSQGAARQDLDNGSGIWMSFDLWGRSVTNSSARVLLRQADNTTITTQVITAATSWTNLLFDARLVGAGCYMALQNTTNAPGDEARYDDISAKPLSGLIAYKDFGTANVQVKLASTIGTLRAMGVVARYVDANNYLYAYLGRMTNTINLIKVLSGNTSSLISIAGTYGVAQNVEIRCNGTTAQLFYNNAQVGTDQTVDAIYSTGTKHGVFSTSALNTGGVFVVTAN